MPDTNHHSVSIRDATVDDLETIASWQCRFLPYGLFPRLGERFVRRWHATFMDGPYGVALIADLLTPTGRVPVGFLVGSTDEHQHIHHVLRTHRIRLAITGLAALVLRPSLCVHFLRTRAKTYISRIFKGADGRLPPPEYGDVAQGIQTAVVTAVAVTPNVRGSGVGRNLLARFIEQSRTAGAPKAELVAMADADNTDDFYKKLGWALVSEHISKDGVVARTFRYEIDD